MITLRIILSPGRRGRVVDASGRSLPQPVPAPVIGSAEPLRIILLDPATLDPADPYGFDTGAPLRLTISGDWDPATIPVYCTNDLERTGVGTYDLADPSGTRTAEALALLGVLAERLCAWELTAYGGDPATEADWAHPLSVVQFDAPLRQRADSLGGDPTEAPAVDLRGPPGPTGPGVTPSDATPLMDGVASAGSSDKCARGDHRHPADASKVDKAGDAMTGPLRVADETASTVVAAGSVRVNNGFSDTAYGAGAIVDPTNGKTRILPANNGTLALQEGIAPAFSTSSTYAVGAYCTHEGLLYKCTTAVATAGAWNAANWTAVAVTDEMGADTPLPFDAECEYITVPDGTCINTEITSRGPILQWEATIRMPSTFDVAGNFRFGSWIGDAYDSTMVWMSSGPRRLDMILAGDRYISDWSAITGQFGKIGYDGRYLFCGDSTVDGPTQAAGRGGAAGNNRPFTLFGLNGEPSPGSLGGDISSARFSFCNFPIRDYTPVRVGTVGYLYDKVSGRLFGSAVGSIPLVPGPDNA